MARKLKRRALPNVSEEHPLPTEHAPDPTGTARLVEDIKETADKFARDKATSGDLKLVSRALKELRYAFKVFTPYRRQRKVTVFGSARTKPDNPSYEQAVEFGRILAKAGWYVVTGAGGGIMEAAHVGAGRAMSMGLNIMLPFEQDANYVINDDEKLVNLRYFFTRKLLFVKEVHAVAMFPGGFGTQDELFETLTLIQTGKRDLMPIVCVDPPGGGYYTEWLDFIRSRLLKDKLISPEDLSLFKVTTSVRKAVDEIMKFYHVYNSMRYVRDELYIRLHHDVSDQLLERLNLEFADLLSRGRIRRAETHPFEADDDHLNDLPRLALHFDRHHFGRLRQMIDVLNDELQGPADSEEEEE
ncbi:MAG: TIGR00730 family Rossman fold protein [Planctomycetaceae bacterium]